MTVGKITAVTLLALALTGRVRGEEGGSRLVANLRAGRPQTVVAYGTSLTAEGEWVRQMAEALEAAFPGLATVVNSGRSGASSDWGTANLDSRVLAWRPDTVLIEFAVNDARLDDTVSLARARGNLEAMIDRILSAGPGTEIILMTMNPPAGSSLLRRPRYRDYYEVYREVAGERGLPLIDHTRNWERILETDPGLFRRYVPDGIHPGPEGCAAVITPKILEALGIPVGARHAVPLQTPPDGG